MNGATSEEELLAAATLEAGPAPPRRCVEWVREHGSCRGALERLPRPLGAAASKARRKLDAIRAAGLEALCYSDPGYPRLLRAAPNPPLVLTIWGHLEEDDALALAIVGSRRASRYGLEMASRLSSELSTAGLTIVSGLARGIDAAAHRGALDAEGRTIAVLGSGLGNVYPREHRQLAERIAAQGAVLSEFDLNEPPLGRNFPRRNRIITGMSLGTLVVEAALKSGSLVSARLALEQDRDVFAVPGPARSPGSEGVHALIRDGAKLVTQASDILEELRPEVRELLSTRYPERAAPRESDESHASDDVERALLAELRSAEGAIDVDTLVERTRIPTHRAIAALGSLEMKGGIWSLPGGLYQAKP